MRARDIGRVFLLALGVFLMTTAEQAPAQDKKPSKLESYDEKVTLRTYYGDKFLKPIEDVPMYRKTDDKGVTRFWLWGPAATGVNQPTKGSEITDKDGAVWLVDKASPGSISHAVTVTKKAVEKKP